MQTLTTCMLCQEETGFPNFSSLTLADIPESGVIENTCDRGHRTATVLQQTKFEILSEMGVKAIVDGFYRDAVSSFATSLERLYEFFITASCRKRGIATEEFAATWRIMAKQSERQLGAFLAAYLFDTGQVAKLLPQKQIEFRNAVVHKGQFPSREEAIWFGQAAFNCALPVLMVLRSNGYAETLRELTSELIRERSQLARDAGLQTSTMSITTPLSFVVADHPRDFASIVASYAERPDFKQAVAESRTLGAIIDNIAKAQDASK